MTIMTYTKKVLLSGGRSLMIFDQWSVAQQCQGQCYFLGYLLVCMIAAVSLAIAFARRKVKGKGTSKAVVVSGK